MLPHFMSLLTGALLLALLPHWLWGPLAGALAALAWLLGWATLQLLRAQQLERWLRDPGAAEPPVLRGLFGDLTDRLRRLLTQRNRQVQEHAERLQYFLRAIQASPNGVTLLDAQGRIEWCNNTASAHLGFDRQRDHLQHVVHLLRDPVFSRYFAQQDHSEEVVIDGRSESLSRRVRVSLQLHPYGEGQRLLLSRDVTAVQQAEAMRRDFVANVSHEIRTPLTVLSGFIETLQSLPLDETQRQHYLGLMDKQSARMRTLVQDLLTLSQLEGSPPPGLQEHFPLRLLMQQVQDDARGLSALQSPETAQAVHALVFDEVDDWQIAGSRTELYSAIGNLVSNAVRYTPAGGQIQVQWRREADGSAWLDVRDSGPGIAPEHLPRLSERFYRVDRSRSRETGGTGLGLAIAKHAIQRHGGELRIRSQVGQGSTFSLGLPASRVMTPDRVTTALA
jgi:two-component system, OmpR family, phosphate regulon sensor histidine kinase PhoR